MNRRSRREKLRGTPEERSAAQESRLKSRFVQPLIAATCNIKMLSLSTFLLNKAPFLLKLRITGDTDAGLLVLLRPGEYLARGQAASSSTNTAERLETGRAHTTRADAQVHPCQGVCKSLLPSMCPRGLRPRNNI